MKYVLRNRGWSLKALKCLYTEYCTNGVVLSRDQQYECAERRKVSLLEMSLVGVSRTAQLRIMCVDKLG